MSLGIGDSLAIITSLKGVFDTYLWIQDLFNKDNDAHWLLLQYESETYKLERWKTKLEDERRRGKDPISELRDTEKQIVQGFMNQIEVLKVDLLEAFQRHNIGSFTNHQIPGSQSSNSNLAHLPVNIQPKKRLEFKAKTKPILEKNIARYKEAAIQLDAWLTRAVPVEPMTSALPAFLLSRPRTESDLTLLAKEAIKEGKLLATCAALRLLELGYDLAIPNIENDAIVLDEMGANRTMGWYKGKRVLVEWKHIGFNIKPGDRDILLKRVKRLGALLYQPKQPEFHIPTCLGVTTGPNFAHGFVFNLPSDSENNSNNRMKQPSWYTLADWLVFRAEEGGRRRKTVPLLGDRFRLAQALVSMFSLLHASRWLHKDFRSDNVLFFDRDTLDAGCERISTADMYVTGFQYSRPDGDTSIESPRHSLYRHPSTEGGYQRQHDWYSLGVVLFEIGVWESLTERLSPDAKPRDVKPWLLESLKTLGAKVGERYRDAVECCLTGNVGGIADNDEELARGFLTYVVDPLAACAA
ncbi:hypothetical protein GGI42DRAFT_328460 [Trichoderma sp. SZMC 28013]